MSIQNEITRISGNVSDSLTAVAAKGVTVPSGSNSDDLPALIASIQTGSGVVIENNKTVSPTESQLIVTPDTNYDALAQVTVNAVSSSYVGSGITRRDSTDLSAIGATVSVPSGYYASNASASVASGTEGTPTATKGSVSSHSIAVTPSVTNVAGYISGGTHTGTAVTVSASELVSGSETKTSNGTYDVTNLAQLIVNVSGGGGGLYPWLGSGAEKVGTILSKTINLANDTTWSSWTPSTTATTLIAASTTNDYTGSLNLDDYDFFLITKGFIEPVYVADTPKTYRSYRTVQYYANYLYGFPNSNTISQWQNDTAGNTGHYSSSTNMFCLYYYNSSGNLASRTGTQCGPLYMDTYPNVSANTPTDGVSTLSYKLPAFKAKCDSSRFSTTRAGQIDAANTNYNITVDLYKVPHGNGLMSHWVSEACAALNAT